MRNQGEQHEQAKIGEEKVSVLLSNPDSDIEERNLGDTIVAIDRNCLIDTEK